MIQDLRSRLRVCERIVQALRIWLDTITGVIVHNRGRHDGEMSVSGSANAVDNCDLNSWWASRPRVILANVTVDATDKYLCPRGEVLGCTVDERYVAGQIGLLLSQDASDVRRKIALFGSGTSTRRGPLQLLLKIRGSGL